MWSPGRAPRWPTARRSRSVEPFVSQRIHCHDPASAVFVVRDQLPVKELHMPDRTHTNRRYLDALEQKVLVFDGAMGTSLQAQNLSATEFGGEQFNGCNDYLV